MEIQQVDAGDYEQIAQLIGTSFGQSANHSAHLEAFWLNMIQTKPIIHAEDLRAIIDDSDGERQIIAFAQLEERILHYGRATLKVALIRHICTTPEHRHRGYASALVRDALATLAERGVHLAILYDEQGYYQQYGFYPIMPDYSLWYRREHVLSLTRLHKPATLRMMEREDLPHVASLYERHWGRRLSLHRSAQIWKWLHASYGDLAQVVTHENEIVGYYWQHPLYTSAEIVADSLEATQALLRHSVEHDPADTLTWNIPPDDDIVGYAQSLLPIELRACYRPFGGWVGRIIDATALIKTIEPELRTQSMMQTTSQPEPFKLEAEPHAITIEWLNKKEASTISHADFVALMFGMPLPSALKTPQGIHALHQLFMRRIASVAMWDC